MEIEYTKIGDYLIPNLTVEKQNKKVILGKYARLKLTYLKEYKQALYISLKMENKLMSHLEEIQNTATEQVEKITKQLAEKLKTENQLKWVGLMNNFKTTAEEIVLKELIYI